MRTSAEDIIDPYGSQQKTWDEHLIELFKSKFTLFLVLAVVYWYGSGQGWFPSYQLGTLEKAAILFFAGGYFLAGPRLRRWIEGIIPDTRIRCEIVPAESELTDGVRIPRDTFSDMDILGAKNPPKGRTIGGEIVFLVRAINFAEGIIIPAKDIDDDDLPDDVELIAHDTDKTALQRLREVLVPLARNYVDSVQDEEVMRIEARSGVANDFAAELETIRNYDADIQSNNPDADDDSTDIEDAIRTIAAETSDEDGGGDDE